MARSRTLRLISLTLANILLPISVLVFASGFFPYKPFLPGLATFEDVAEPGAEVLKQSEPVFDRVVFMVVDALRSDFVFGHGSAFGFVQSLIRDGAAIPFTAHATPPTVTMPRVKALTTGSVPSFLDLILNFAESDTTSSLSTQDTWLAQLRAARNGKLVFYGDDTWLKLFPEDSTAEEPFWLRHDGTSSFFVSDFTEVDNNVTRNVPAELAREDWSAMVMHYLGLDHIGHKTGPQGPNMLPKQREMDGIVEVIYQAIERETHHERTLLVLMGDHGMNAGGNHGGSGPGETEPAMVFASPRFKEMEKRRVYECPTLPKEGTEFHYYSKIGQSDLVPTLAAMMGIPVSKNSLGVLIRELATLWPGGERLQLLHQNARQLLHIVRAKYGAEWFEGRVQSQLDNLHKLEWGLHDEVDQEIPEPEDDAEKLAFRWARLTVRPLSFEDSTDWGVEGREGEYYLFLEAAQKAMSDTASSYDVPRMLLGIALTGAALVLAIVSFPSLWPPSSAGVFFTAILGLYGVMMFASSYVEEEQHFWYWVTPAWIAVLTFNKLREANTSSTSSSKVLIIAISAFALLTTHRLCVRWNQTGQKHAGDPDIVHDFFPDHHILMWLLILATYTLNGYFLHQRSFAGLFMPELAAFFTSSMVFLGIVFKLNFTQADAPELVQGLAEGLRVWSEPLGLVWQARAVFVFLGVAVAGVVVLSAMGKRGERRGAAGEREGSEVDVGLAERLHHLLTLFLMTQTRAPNVPLFAFVEIQRAALSVLLSSSFSPANDSSQTTAHNSTPERMSRALQTATSALLLSHTYFFCMGGSNSISSIDLSNAYNGVADYNIAAVGILLFASNWAGPLWWCSAAVLLVLPRRQTTPRSNAGSKSSGKDGRVWVQYEREKLREDATTLTKTRAGVDEEAAQPADPEAWSTFLSSMTSFIAASLVAVMAACTVLRTHLFIWTVFSPKYLYAMAWSVGWHLVVNAGLGSLLGKLGGA